MHFSFMPEKTGIVRWRVAFEKEETK